MIGLGEPGGFSLSLVTESFAVRALLGSVAAAVLAALLIGLGVLRSPGARRAALLTPAVVAALAAIASVGEAFLPRILVATASADGPVVEHLGEYRGLQAGAGVDVLLTVYVAIAAVLVARRLLGTQAWRRHTATATPVPADSELAASLGRLADRMGVTRPTLLLEPGCAGGAFAAGLRHPVIVVDPVLMSRLDRQEAEGLLAHELAHLARRDALVCLTVGLARDLAWFLAPLSLATRWLHREREESADELASRCTGRPAALASGILKVWDRSDLTRAPAPTTCAAVGVARVPSAVVLPGRAGRRARRIVAARVERLIAAAPAPSVMRCRAEALLACAVLAASASAALTLPSWIASTLGADSVDFLYLSGRTTVSAESPAFATFRGLTPGNGEAAASVDARPAAAATPGKIESRAELLAGERRTAPADRLSWGSQEHPAWSVTPPGDVRRARPLVYTLNDAGAHMGVFVVGAADR